jgi:hypothetical protein
LPHFAWLDLWNLEVEVEEANGDMLKEALDIREEDRGLLQQVSSTLDEDDAVSDGNQGHKLSAPGLLLVSFLPAVQSHKALDRMEGPNMFEHMFIGGELSEVLDSLETVHDLQQLHDGFHLVCSLSLFLVLYE